jgi:anthranilate phosphoribosyltransferase
MNQTTWDGVDIIQNGTLSELTAKRLLTDILCGNVADTDISTFLAYLSTRTETVDEMVGFASAMRDHMIPVPLTFDYCLDLCGTGGSGKPRFNVSTAAAFILAAMGHHVAKHGNYGSYQSNGSFNFLDALGVSYNMTIDELQSQFNKTHLCFLLAKTFHPGMKYVAPARRALKRRTVFNLLGPLCNPASVTHQVIGTTSIENAHQLAAAFQRLGGNRAIIVVGGDGRDELSLTGTNRLFVVSQQHIDTFDWISDVAVEITNFGNANENATLFTKLVKTGDTTHPIITYILANVGLSLFCIEKAGSITDGIQKATQWFTHHHRQLNTYF